MQSLPSLLLSTFFHVSLAYAAIHSPIKKSKPKVSAPYTLELVSTPQNHVITKKPVKKINKRKKRIKKQVQRKLVTQEQKSPVKVEVKEETVESQSASNTVVRDARLLKQKEGNRAPIYSMSDRLRKRTGRVVVMGFVTPAGDIEQVRIEQSTGSPTMDENSILAFSQYKFEEGQTGWVKMPYEFMLEGESKILSTRDRTQLQNLNQ